MRIKGALSLEIDEEYFINNIEDDGSYDWDAGDELYTKTITANNLDFSIDNDGKQQRKLQPCYRDYEFMGEPEYVFRYNFESHN